MKTKLFLTFVVAAMTMVCWTNAMTFITFAQNDEPPYFVSPDEMKISYEVWPKEILSDDCYYITYIVENCSDQPLNVSVHDLFKSSLLSMDGGFHVTKIHYIPGYPVATFGGYAGVSGTFASTEVRTIEQGSCTIPPGEKRVVHADLYIGRVSEEFLEKHKDEDGIFEVKITIIEGKYKYCLEKTNPKIHVLPRTTEEKQLIDDFLAYHKNYIGGYTTSTKCGVYNMDIFFLAKRIPVFPRTDKNLSTLSAWREFEAKLSPGTLRDEIRLGRIQVQYLDGDKEAALNELREWFAVMEPIQSMTLAASLCLPEGLEEESDKDELFKPVGTLKDEPEAHKHYMAMRREIDKIVASYNTLPKRKLRETLAY